MSLTLCTALCLQVLTVALIRSRLGRGWLLRPTTYLILASLTYSGLSEILLRIPSIRAWDSGRLGIGQSYIDMGALVISAGLLALVICYLVTNPKRPSRPISSFDTRYIARSLDWRLLLSGCVPLAIFTYEGRGYNSGAATGMATASSDFASEFLLMLVVLTAFSFLLSHGMRWFVTVLAVQSILLAAAGERLPVLMAAITLLVLLAYVHMRPSGRQIGIASALTVVTVLAITGYRAEGRALYHQNSGLKARVEALGSGLYILSHTSDPNDTSPGLLAQAAARFDGNAFAGGVLQGFHDGDPSPGAAAVWESMLVVIPSSIWSSKLTHSGLNPAFIEDIDFGLLTLRGGVLGPLPTFPGLYLGFLGPYWLIAYLAALGVIFGWGERWMFREITAVRIIFLAAALQGVLAYESGPPALFSTLRTAVILALFSKLIGIARCRTTQRILPAGGETALWRRRVLKAVDSRAHD